MKKNRNQFENQNKQNKEELFDESLFHENISQKKNIKDTPEKILELEDDYYSNEEEVNTDIEKTANKVFTLKHLVFFGVVLIIFIFAIIRLAIWNKGIDSGYDPNEDTSEFDTEPLDHIQPLNSSQLAGKADDGVTTIFCFGNSTFADNGSDNALAKEIGDIYDANVINASFSDSLQSKINENYSESEPRDGISLYSVTEALITKDFSQLDSSAAAISEEASTQADYLKTVDFSTADMMVIMYDLSDYIELRPVFDPGNTSNPITVAGALESTIQMVQEKYPYIRIVVLSTPASGKTVDSYYVDGDIHDLGNGTLVDYLGYTAQTCVSNGVSFIDTYFGVINLDTRDKYLTDDYHINEEGAKAVAKRLHKLIGIS